MTVPYAPPSGRARGWVPQFVRFLAVGVANTAVGLGTIWALIWAAGWGDVPANAAGYGVGLICSFALNRRWTFDHRGAWLPAAGRFALVFVVAYGANVLAMLGLRDSLALDRYLAHALATIPYTVLFFVGSRLFAFRAPASSQTSDMSAPGP